MITKKALLTFKNEYIEIKENLQTDLAEDGHLLDVIELDNIVERIHKIDGAIELLDFLIESIDETNEEGEECQKNTQNI